MQPLAHVRHIYNTFQGLAELDIANQDVQAWYDDISDNSSRAMHGKKGTGIAGNRLVEMEQLPRAWSWRKIYNI